jgi:hypothetical protein
MKPRFAIVVIQVLAALGFSQSIPRKAPGPNSSFAHYQLGEKLLSDNNLQSAANEFREALSGDLQPTWTEVWSHINLGKIFDASDQRDRAINEYRLAARTGDNTRGALDQARQYLTDHSVPLPPVYRLSDGIMAPERIQITEAEYSAEGRAAGLEGTVFIMGVVDEDGSVHDTRSTRKLGLGLDEVAIQKVQQWHFTPGTFQAGTLLIPVDFLLPSLQSRWHLVRAEFFPQAQTSRPIFLGAKYPVGAGVGLSAIDEARIVAAVGSMAWATLSFEVDEHGIPARFNVDRASLELWGPQAIAVVSEWRFTPGMKNGAPVAVPCTLELVWGRRDLEPLTLARWLSVN